MWSWSLSGLAGVQAYMGYVLKVQNEIVWFRS
jgi:hypothetical protein